MGLQICNHELVLVEKLVKLFCSNYGENIQITAAVYYFYYDYHDHYQYHIFHKHCKMHLHLTGFILMFPLDCNMISDLPSLIPS